MGAITPSIRMISLGLDGLKSFSLRAYFATDPLTVEIEEINVVSAETASEIFYEHDKVECIFVTEDY